MSLNYSTMVAACWTASRAWPNGFPASALFLEPENQSIWKIFQIGAIFLQPKYPPFRKMFAERNILHLLETEPITLHPLNFTRVDEDGSAPSWADAAFEVNWQGKQSLRFVADVKSRVTSQLLAAAAQRAKSLAFDAQGALPLVIVPYLSPASLDEAEKLGISAVDLCGNGIVQVPERWLVLRTGSPNRFRGSDPVRGAYRGIASLVARAFMVQPAFSRVSEIQAFIEARGARITLATVSKALARLEEDLVVAREAKLIRLLQSDKLLSKLQTSYQPPLIRRKLMAKSRLSELELHQRLRDAAESLRGRIVLTGISSASRQTVIATEPITSFYCSMSPEELVSSASIDPSPQSRFADLELIQTSDERVYFDAREDAGRVIASPVQTWLELATGDKRAQEVAKDLRLRLLREVRGRSSNGR